MVNQGPHSSNLFVNSKAYLYVQIWLTSLVKKAPERDNKIRPLSEIYSRDKSEFHKKNNKILKLKLEQPLSSSKCNIYSV